MRRSSPTTARSKVIQRRASRRARKSIPKTRRVEKYFGYLSSKHDNALQKVGAAKKVYSYGYVFNGFAAELTDAQAAKLKAMSDVVTVWKDEERTVDTNRTPAFLGLSASGGLWDQLGGQGSAGEDIVIGMVDSGSGPKIRASRIGTPRENWSTTIFRTGRASAIPARPSTLRTATRRSSGRATTTPASAVTRP